MWQEQNATALAEALIFPSEHATPMRPENWLRRRIKPIAARLGITVPVNFQVLRRTFATNAQGYGNPKDVQAHLRHTDIATTLDVYTQELPESVRKLVNAVAHDVHDERGLADAADRGADDHAASAMTSSPRNAVRDDFREWQRSRPGILNTIAHTVGRPRFSK